LYINLEVRGKVIGKRAGEMQYEGGGIEEKLGFRIYIK
jgi:hypothetical protein